MFTSPQLFYFKWQTNPLQTASLTFPGVINWGRHRLMDRRMSRVNCRFCSLPQLHRERNLLTPPIGMIENLPLLDGSSHPFF
jgi:hypothetical protein